MSPVPAVVFDDPVLEAAVRKGLDEVEAMLRDKVVSDYPFVTETSRYLVEAGGKRFRPLLVLLAGQFGDPTSAALVPTAVAIELTHLSTLYHDDVMDEAPLRRGAQSANDRWTNTVAILTGDFLFARASEITADLGTQATRILARTIAILCEGQIRETVGADEGADPVEHYLRVVAEKTGSLIATSGRLGALMCGADQGVVATMTEYGEAIGIAFQLSDDLLDIAGDPTESGKVRGTDLREGVLTLPVLYALQGDDPVAERLRQLVAGTPDEATVTEALELVRAHPAMARAEQTLAGYADRARALAGGLPDVPAKAALLALADFVVTRHG